ncbi:MAG: hypothetical protein PHQ40_15595 [Anaerolineaceae bacterium]|nr:hypothetical protein [Anaerolineaceae bacterium]
MPPDAETCGEFHKYVIRSQKLPLIAAIEWIRANLKPEDVFPKTVIDEEDEY